MENILIGNNPSIKKIRELITMVSGMALNVLLLGETGTGKDVVARLLYKSSPRNKKRFIKVNCAALPMSLLESELFGYEKGAFTGADRLKPGKFEQAAGGVMFLDEIGDMPLILQAKLLNVLQSGEYSRLGGTENIKADAWVVTSTNHDLDQDIKSGLFREDLFYRLNIIKIEMPPLRDRKEDIPVLAEYFLHKNKAEMKIENDFVIEPELSGLFQEYHWPGNIRELSNIMLRLSVGDDPDKVRYDILRNMNGNGEYSSPDSNTNAGNTEEGENQNKTETLKDIKLNSSRYIEKRVIRHVLDMTEWNKSKAAQILKISYKTLFTKMHELGIE